MILTPYMAQSLNVPGQVAARNYGGCRPETVSGPSDASASVGPVTLAHDVRPSQVTLQPLEEVRS
jgi:hypothetical protein